MKIGVDVDEVLAQMNEKLVLFHNEKYGTTQTLNDYTRFDLSYIWKTDVNEAIKRINEFYDSSYFTEITTVPSSLESIAKLSKDHELIIITSRYKRIEERTIEWIERNYGKVFSKIFFATSRNHIGKEKWEIALDEKIDIHIDDASHIAKDMMLNGIPCLLMNRPWNQEEMPEGVIRVHSWEEVLHHINSLSNAK